VDKEIVILVVGAVGMLGFFYWFLSRTEASRLRDQYFLHVHQPRAQAEESLARHLQRQQEKHPGKSEAWYLRQVLAELRRDRR
jgi:hypothetical protein